MDELLNCTKDSNVSLSEPLVSTEITLNTDFKFEIDLGLALPFRFHCKEEDLKKSHAATVMKSIDESGKIKLVKVSTQSDEGPLQAVENDVLLVLLSMAYEQYKNKKEFENIDIGPVSGTRVYFTLAEICRRLNLDVGSSGRVKKAIKRIYSQKITYKQMEYSRGDSKPAIDIVKNHKIIVSDGEIRISSKKNFDKFREFFYVDLDAFIVSNLFKDYFSVIEPSHYLSLGIGGQRRLLIFLQSKRKQYGDCFTFELAEMVEVLGIDDQQRTKRAALSILSKVAEKSTTFKYTLKEKRKGKEFSAQVSNFIVLIEFDLTNRFLSRYEPFYQSLCDFYGEATMKGLDILEFDVVNLKSEIEAIYSKQNNGSAIYPFNKREILVSEFVIDVALYQMIICDYKVESFKAFCKYLTGRLIDGGFELPEKYRAFVIDRVKEIHDREASEKIRKIEEQKRRKEEEEKILFEKTYEDMFKNLIMTSDNTKTKLTKIAQDELAKEGILNGAPLYSRMLEAKMYEIGKVLVLKGELHELRGDTRTFQLQ